MQVKAATQIANVAPADLVGNTELVVGAGVDRIESLDLGRVL